LTPAQQTALDYHCRFAFETAHPRFGNVIFSPWGRASLVLTVNSGYE
jgi:hypothetical protein